MANTHRTVRRKGLTCEYCGRPLEEKDALMVVHFDSGLSEGGDPDSNNVHSMGLAVYNRQSDWAKHGFVICTEVECCLSAVAEYLREMKLHQDKCDDSGDGPLLKIVGKAQGPVGP